MAHAYYSYTKSEYYVCSKVHGGLKLHTHEVVLLFRYLLLHENFK
jgi:hypothetical protein